MARIHWLLFTIILIATITTVSVLVQLLANAHTSEKAGLEKNAWKDQDTKVSRFEGIIFKEESPNGKIVRGII